jgi:F1F0 ATPase subunit 2
MIEHLPWTMQAPVGLIVGVVAGRVHFSTLRRNVELLSSGRAPRAFAMQAARLAGLLVVLFVLAKLGASALLFGAAGVLVARSTVLRQVSGAAP